MKLETSVGWVEASELSVEETRTETAAGPLTTKKFFLGEQLVKIDQHLDVSEAALEAAGFTKL